MNLASVRDSAEQIAVAINRVMGVDVVIIDDKLDRITDTFRYDRDRIAIRKESIVGRIIESGKPLAIDDKKVFRSCVDCPDFQNCRMQSLIGVPILYQEKTVGAIALAISPRHMKDLFGNLSHTVGFLAKMAEMLAGKLQAAADYETLNLAKMQRELLIDSIEDGLVLVNPEGRILYNNGTFANLFLRGADATDHSLIDVISHPRIEAFFQNRRPFKNKLIYCEAKQGSFDGYISVAPFEVEGEYHGAIFTFRSISNVDAACTEAREGYYRLEHIMPASRYTAKLHKQAAAAAAHSEAVLIEGAEGYRKREIAYAIHNASARAGGNFLVVDCKKSAPQELEEELFGAVGKEGCSKLRLAHKGTLCLCAADALPQYLQRRLCDYLVRGTVVISYGETVADARLILTTSQNLDELVDQGLFDETLYERVRAGRIFLPPLSAHHDDVLVHFSAYVDYFAARYATGTLDVDPEVQHAVCRFPWPADMPQLRSYTEYMVKNARGGKITMEQLPAAMRAAQPAEDTGAKPVKAMVEEQIRRLIASGKSNDEIASILEISRATLYRKFKEYNINRREIQP